MNIVLLGAPGSGKGTLSNHLVEKYHFFQVAPGDIFRKNIKDNTVLGQKIKSIVDAGNLVPDSLVSEVTKDYIVSLNTTDNIIVDGFPRTIQQAENLFQIFADLHITLDAVIYLDINKEIILERLSNRKVCLNCGKVYHSISMPEKVLNVCDVCQGRVERRKDDNPESITIRFDNFQKQTMPLIEYYKNKNLLHTFKNVLDVNELVTKVLSLNEKK